MDPVDAAIEQAARTLHLPTIRDGYEEAVEHALRERCTYKQFLADPLGTEVDHRDERRKLRLVREANFSRPKRIEDFDYSANPDGLPEQINTLCDPAWVVAGQPLCLIGDSGTGKSHLLIGIGTAIAEAGYKVRYTTAANLVNELAEAADDRQLTKVIARYGRCDLLCLDEFGYLDLDKAGAKLLFQISPTVRNAGRSRSHRRDVHRGRRVRRAAGSRRSCAASAPGRPRGDPVRNRCVPPAATGAGHGDRGAASFVLHDTLDPDVFIAEIDVAFDDVDGRQTKMSLVQIFRLRDGQIAMLRDYFAGCSPSPPRRTPADLLERTRADHMGQAAGLHVTEEAGRRPSPAHGHR
jgi:DNA replication protein DnaC